MAKKMVFIPPWGPYMEVDEQAPSGSAAPDFVGAPPQIYKEEGDPTIRGEGPAPAAGPAPMQPQRTQYAPPQAPANTPFPAPGGGGGRMGGGSTGTMVGGGGGKMAAYGGSTAQKVTQNASLDPSVWGKYDPSATLTQTGQYAGQAGGIASELAGVNPQVGPMDRTLYDKYQGLLLDPSSIQSSQNFGFQLDRAQEAARRQLAAGRGRHSGRALEELAGVTVGNIGAQFRDLASVYGAGAGEERARWAGQTGAGLDAARIRTGALGDAGRLAIGAGDLGVKAAEQGTKRTELELNRVRYGIQSPTEQYQAAVKAGSQPTQYAMSSLGYTPGAANWAPTTYQPYTGPQDYASWVRSNWGSGA